MTNARLRTISQTRGELINVYLRLEVYGIINQYIAEVRKGNVQGEANVNEIKKSTGDNPTYS